MLVAWLPLLVALLVGFPSTVTPQTLDHQQLDVSGAIGTNPARPGDFGGKHLSKHQTHSIENPIKPSVSMIPSFFHKENIISQNGGNFGSKYEVENHHHSSDRKEVVQKLSKMSKQTENIAKSSSPCPEPTDIAPCICSLANTNDLMLDCSDVESSDQLAAIFMQNFPFKQFKEFRIYDNNNIQYLSEIFNGLSFQEIYLRNVPNLARITDYAFIESRNTLESIYIHTSALDENTFPFGTLHGFTKLNSLYIYINNINIWPAFNSSTIESADISYGNISALPAGEK